MVFYRFFIIFYRTNNKQLDFLLKKLQKELKKAEKIKKLRESLGAVNLRADEETKKYETEIKKMEDDPIVLWSWSAAADAICARTSSSSRAASAAASASRSARCASFLEAAHCTTELIVRGVSA